MSSFKINFLKSVLIGIKVGEAHLYQYANTLGRKVGSFPVSYLGLPLCFGSVRKDVWNPVAERVERKLSIWKANYLSIGGRVTLIKSVLANIPVYFLSTFKCPVSIISRIEKLQQDFLWHRSEQMKFHWVD